MSNNKSIAERIIDGTYTEKETIADKIINGTYTSTSTNTNNKTTTTTSGKKALNTGLKLISNIGTGALKGVEGISDLITTGIGYTASGAQSLWDKEGALKTKKFWEDVTKTNVIDDTIGQAVDNVYGKNSYIGQGNKVLDMADSIIEGTAEMIPGLILGNEAVNAVSKLGLTAKTVTAVEKANLATKTADKLTKASQTAKNVTKATNLATKATAATNTANKLNKVAKLYTTADKAVKTVAGIAPFVTQATGNSISQALNEGASYNEAVKYGALSGLTEGLVESISGGIGGTVSNKVVSKVLAKPSINKALNNFVSSNIGKFITKAGDIAVDAFGEGVEELISGVINPYIERMTYNEKAELANNEELMEQFVSGALGSLLMKGGNALVNVNSNQTIEVQDNETQSNVLPTASQNIKVTPNIPKESLQANTTADYINNINNRVNGILPTANQVTTNIESLPTAQNGKYSNGNITLNSNNLNTKTYGHELTHHLAQNKGYDSYSDFVLTELDKTGKLSTIKEEIINTYQPIYEQEGRILTEEDINQEVVSKYTEQLFKDEKSINNLLKTDRNVFQKVYDWVVDKINYYKNVSSMSIEERQEYDNLRKAEKLFRKALESEAKPKIVNDLQKNMESITIANQNMLDTSNSNKKKQSLIDLINSLNNIDQNYKKSMIDGINNINNLDENTYNSMTLQIKEIDSEYKNYNASKVNKNSPKINYDKSIIENAIELIPTNKQGKRTKQEWLKVAQQIGNNVNDKTQLQQYAEKSWRELHPNIADNLNRQGQKYVKFTKEEWINAVKGNNETKYSIAGKKAMQNIVEYDKNNFSLKDNYYIAQSMQKNGVDNETIRKNTHWFQDKNGDWKFEFSDRDMSLKTNIKLQDGKTYKLGDILKHDALFIAYPELADYNVEFKNIKANGAFYKNDNSIILNSNKLNSNSLIEGTLIHEIQHAIQHIENFESGTSSKFSKLAYYNSLGEIEADDTKQRFIAEKYKNKDISNIAPKSSKTNPQHRNLEEYLNTRTNIDKFKDMIYPSVKNFFDKVGGINEEIITEHVEENTQKNNDLVDGRRRLEKNLNKSSFFDANLSKKEKQLKIILEQNPMKDDYHTGIRTIEDIKTFDEVIDDDESFVWGDFTQEDAKQALEKGTVTVYSSKPITNGSFVSTSQNQAKDYAGNGKIYSQEVSLEDVAWINGDEGQYAKVENAKYSLNEEEILSGIYENVPHRTSKDNQKNNKRIEEYLESKYPDYHISFTNYKNDGEVVINLIETKQEFENRLKSYKNNNFKETPRVEIIPEDAINFKYNERPEFDGKEWRDLEDIRTRIETLTNELDKSGEFGDYGVDYEESHASPDATYVTLEDNEGETKTIRIANHNDSTGLSDYHLWLSDYKSKTELINDLKKLIYNVRNGKSDIRYSLEGKTRSHYETIKNSNMVDKAGKEIANNLLKNERYIPLKNSKAINYVEKKLVANGINNSYIEFKNKLNSNDRMTVNDIAMGERLIQELSKTGDFDTVADLIQDVAVLGTELGQQVQAMSLINKMTPEGQLHLLTKTINRLNKTTENLDTEIALSKKSRDAILKADSKEALDEAVSKATIEIAEQIPLTTSDKLRSWRYLSMLGNPRTHIGNVLSNVAMKGTQTVKNKVAGAIEDVVNPTERTKTFKTANKETKKFASLDADKIQSRLTDGGHEDIMSKVKINKRSFDNRTLNAMSEFNSNMLEKEDWIFLKSAYKNSLANYMTANKLTAEYLKSGSKEANIALEKAREYAISQAQEATFRQYSQLASDISRIENRNAVSKFIVGGALPFKKTPINIAKAGFEYSPIGLLKATKEFAFDIKKGNKTVNQAIDSLAKGLTGTSIMGIGMLLASQGILKASGSDDEKEEKYSQSLGNQDYSIKIGDSTYTLDWLSPTAMPLFAGAELWNATQTDNDFNLNNLVDASLKTINPLMEMSMLQSFTSALTSYNSDGTAGKLSDMALNVAESYAGQFVPTLLGQVARTIDDTERDTSYSDKTGISKELETFTNRIVAKIPVASMTLQPKTDIWGNEVKRSNSILARAGENMLAPYYKKNIQTSQVDTELQRVYKATGEGVLPSVPNSKVTINKTPYKLSPEDYTEYKKTYGTIAKTSLNKIISTKEYKQLDDEEKAKVIQSVYSDALSDSKEAYANKNDITYEKSTTDIKVDDLVNNGLSLINSYIYKGEISKIEGTKNSDGKTVSGSTQGNKAKYIMDMNTSDTQKDKLLSLLNDSEKAKNVTVSDLNKIDKSSYSTFFGLSATEDSKGNSQRDKYLMLREFDIECNELDKYMTQIGKITGDKDEEGKTIKNSKLIKVFQMIDELNIEPLQKVALLVKSGYTSETENLMSQYINSLDVSNQRKIEILNMLYDF